MFKTELRKLSREELLELVTHLRLSIEGLDSTDENYEELLDSCNEQLSEVQLLLEEGYYIVLPNYEIIDFFEDLSEAKIAKEEYILARMMASIVPINHCI